jgi:hypothetical protein
MRNGQTFKNEQNSFLENRDSFTENTSKITGKSKRSVEQSVKIGRNI